MRPGCVGDWAQTDAQTDTGELAMCTTIRDLSASVHRSCMGIQVFRILGGLFMKLVLFSILLAYFVSCMKIKIFRIHVYDRAYCSSFVSHSHICFIHPDINIK